MRGILLSNVLEYCIIISVVVNRIYLSAKQISIILQSVVYSPLFATLVVICLYKLDPIVDCTQYIIRRNASFAFECEHDCIDPCVNAGHYPNYPCVSNIRTEN